MSPPTSAAPASPWRPLRIGTFRDLLIAALVSDVGTFFQSVGAAWLMVSLTHRPIYVALIQTASTLPFFLLALPAGSIGDIVDRRKLILGTELWMLGVAVVLAVAAITRSMSPGLLLWLTAAIAAGAALEAPAWRAIFSELVPKEDLAQSFALSGIEFNLARAVGPGLAGLTIAAAGVATAFTLNALSFLGVILVIARWRRPARRDPMPAETFGGATVAAVRYVRYAPALRTVLLRTGCVMFFASAFWALLPAVAARLGKSSLGYGLLLAFFGSGAVLGAVVVPRLRSRMSTEALLSASTLLFAGVVAATALSTRLAVAGAFLLLGGAAWTIAMSVFNTLAQSLAPAWVRTRVQAVYLLVFQGSLAAGSAAWGLLAERTGIRPALLAAAAGTAGCLLLAAFRRLPETEMDLSAWDHWAAPVTPAPPQADEGPVLVTVEYRVDPGRAADFVLAMQELGRIRRRDGATRWGLFHDTQAAGRYLEIFLVASWAEHLRQHGRFTLADREVEERVGAYALAPPAVSHLIAARVSGRD